jgi:hypothetical protein
VSGKPEEEPEPPTGVRLIDQHGMEHPVEVYFAGHTPGGIARWFVITPDAFPLAGVRMDTMPPRSELILPRSPDDI